jgi:hypothetical protein
VSAEYTADGCLHFVHICGSFEAENAAKNFLPLPRDVTSQKMKIFNEFRENGTLY